MSEFGLQLTCQSRQRTSALRGGAEVAQTMSRFDPMYGPAVRSKKISTSWR